MRIYAVYILTNETRGTLYIGVSNDLKRRMLEHRLGLVDGFTKKYSLKKLVHVEQFKYINNAIKREKQLKRWHREWKINLIEEQNPEWNDLYESIFGPE
ncbi:MAG: Excinuclease ABC C subunit domain protein [candidate division TM6 bacterium GW2011_GWF2_37_49]|nr:MAG: Excinuclease ABC C subunit domain protein [candidate division TM6 bacterium GW2011_GWF2_37_49]